MLKVNEGKLLFDHEQLVAKRETNLAEVEADARAYAEAHDYDEEKTEKFIAFTKELEGDGLSSEEKAKLEILESYIEEVEDPVEETVADGNASTASSEKAIESGYAVFAGI